MAQQLTDAQLREVIERLAVDAGLVLTDYVVISEWTDPSKGPNDEDAWEIRVDTADGTPPWRSKGLVIGALESGVLDPEEDEEA